MSTGPAKKPRRRRPARKIRYVLRLYVTGTTGKSVRAIQNVRRICEEHLKDLYELEVIDIYKNLPLARGDQIIAAPTLIKRLPVPLRRLIGDMSDEQRVLVGLDLRSRPASKDER
jgi:circadian clock protein KaiB